jgi:23S rRNA pseudouridine2457 synthase
MTAAVGFPTLRLIRTKIGAIDLVRLGLQPGEQTEIEPLLYPDFKDLPEDQPYRSRSYVKKPGGTGGKPMHQKKKEGDKKDPNKKKSGTKRIWQMDESEKPRRKTNGTTRPNTKAPRGRSRNGR